MHNLKIIYLGALPYAFLIANSIFNWVDVNHLEDITFFYTHAIINFVCGYHWTLTFTAITNQARVASVIISLISVIFGLIFLQGRIFIAGLGLVFLAITQLILDFKSDIAGSIPMSYKIARLFASLLMIGATTMVLILR